MNNFTQSLTSVSRLSIDKITLLCKVKNIDKPQFKENMSDLVNDGILTLSTNKGGNPNYRRRYYSDIINDDGSTGKLVIETHPYKNQKGSPRGYFRIESNPNKCDSYKVAHIIQYLLGKELYKKFYNKCWITRADFTFDIPDITTNNLLVYIPGLRKSKLIRDEDGIIETIETGSRLSQSFYNTYDKNRQLNIKTHDDLTRFEVSRRFRGKNMNGKKMRIKGLKNIHNVFDNMNIYDSNIDESLFPREFIRTLKEEALQSALMSVDRTKRPSIIKKLERYRIEPFNAEIIWEGKSEALSFLKAFKI